MSDLRCKNCGGDVDFDKTTGIGTCQYCGSKQAIQIEEKDSYNKQFISHTGKKSKIEIFLIILFKVLFPLMVLYALILCFTL